MSKHTPGPWFISRSLDYGEMGTVVRDAPECGVVMAVVTNRPELMANARLIAAAPMMFAFIEKKAAAGDVDAAKILETVHGRD